jgi:hypothetical protein
MKELRIILFAFGILFAIAYFFFEKPKFEFLEGGDIQKAELMDSLTNVIDSLKHELYVTQTIVDRYEIAISIYKEDNPKAMEKLEYILYTQTE